MPYFVGVAGGTGAGKTTLVRTLVDRFGGCVLDLDSYYVDRGAVSGRQADPPYNDGPAPCRSTALTDPLLSPLRVIDLSAFIAEAARGEHIVITRHRRPIASLTRADLGHIHVGSRASRGGALRRLFKRGTKGAYLGVLVDDRRTRAGHAS